MRRILTVREHEELGVPLADMLAADKVDLYAEVQGRGYLHARLARDRIVFAASSYVGLIPLNDRVAIEVLPKVPVQQLTRIVGIASHAPTILEGFSRRYQPYRDDLGSVLDLVCASFISAVDEVLRKGLHRVYEQRAEDTSFPRGRILIGKTMAHRARRKNHLVAAAWYQPSVDTLPNQLLRRALSVLAKRFNELQPRRGHREMVSQLQRLFLAMNGVSVHERTPFPLEDLKQELPQLEKHWRYYAPAVNLALLILQGAGVLIERPSGTVELASMLINMDVLFEEYVRAVLRSALAAWQLEVLDGNLAPPTGAKKRLFRDGSGPVVTPDAVVRDGSQATRAILEVKYKTPLDVLSREDLSQAITYALSYGSRFAILVHATAAGSSSYTSRLGLIDGVTVYQCGMNLDSDLASEETALAHSVSTIARS